MLWRIFWCRELGVMAIHAGQEPYPYCLPIWRRSYRAASPDGRRSAEIVSAHEVSMGNPTQGLLRLSCGLELYNCSPSFIWSDDSRYLAVPQFISSYVVLRRQWLVVIDMHSRECFGSPERAWYFQPESFDGGRLRVKREPFRQGKIIEWDVPEGLVHFRNLRICDHQVTQRSAPPRKSSGGKCKDW